MSSSKPAAAAVERIIGWIPSGYRYLASGVIGYYDSPAETAVMSAAQCSAALRSRMRATGRRFRE